jgi:glycogen synthase
MKISIVINTYNRMRSLPDTLTALSFLRYPELEVIVVDGPSDDGTTAYLRSEWAGKVKICHCPEANLGKSRNVGIQNASGDIICFTDDDGVPEADWLNKLVVAYRDPTVGAAGGWVRNHTGVQFQTKYIVSSRDSTSEINLHTLDSVPTSAPNTEKFPGLIGVNSSFRRSSLLEIGGFDEEYAYFLDETDVLARIVNAGYSVKMIPDAEVHHKYAPSHIRNQNGVAKSWFQIVTSTCYYILKNALPEASLPSLFEQIEGHKNAYRGHTRYFLDSGLINKARFDVLMDEIERGAEKGISDAFAFPNRQLLASSLETEFLSFPARLPAEHRLRLALVTGYYPPRPCGGVAVFIHNLARKLADWGHEVTVITQAVDEAPHTVDFEEGVWVHRLPNDDSIGCALPDSLPDMPHEARVTAGRVLAELLRVNERRRFQLVLGTIWDLDLAAVIASKAFPVAMYLVTSYKLMEDSKPEWKANRHYYEHHVLKMIRAEAWALRNATHVLASTQAIRRDMETVYQQNIDDTRVTLLPFGVPPPSRPDSASQDGRIRMLFVGRLEQRKGADLLMQILPALFARNPQLEFICIGDDKIRDVDGQTYVEKFRKQNEGASWFGRFHVLGHVDDAKLEEAYALCDFFVAPSRYESFGLIYLEAMRYGKACIGCSAGGIPEVVDHLRTGLLVPPGDAEALQVAIQALIDDPALRTQMGEAGRALFHKQFTVERFATRVSEQIKQWVSHEAHAPVATLARTSHGSTVGR